MADVAHGNLVPGAASGIHVAHRWVVADAAARAALVVTAADVGGLALQTDTGLFYIRTPVGWAAWADAAAIAASIALKADNEQAINEQTGTTYTLVAADLGKLVRCTNAAAITLTVPDTFSAGAAGKRALVNIEQGGAGVVTVVGSGTRVMAVNGLTNRTRGQGAEITLSLTGTTGCRVGGDVAVF